MSSRNDETSGMGAAIGIVGGAALIMFMFLFALAAFVSLCLTILCVLAWNKPLQIGPYELSPRPAQAFIRGGIIGAGLVPLFAAFCSLLFNMPLVDSAWAYLVLGGYVVGSLGMGYLTEKQIEEEANQNAIPMVLPPVAQNSQPQMTFDHIPFRFASWDDEEELK